MVYALCRCLTGSPLKKRAKKEEVSNAVSSSPSRAETEEANLPLVTVGSSSSSSADALTRLSEVALTHSTYMDNTAKTTSVTDLATDSCEGSSASHSRSTSDCDNNIIIKAEGVSSFDTGSLKSADNNKNETSTSPAQVQQSSLSRTASTSSYEYVQKGGGRIRLPDKLMEYLNKKVTPKTLWWQPDGSGFAFDADAIQTNFLDVHFRGTKLTSFIRSLNRW